MKIVHFVRHAEYENPLGILPGRLPMHLSPHGVAQAGHLQNYFAHHAIERIYSSAVLRCEQTAEIIAMGMIPIEFDNRLLETLCAYQGYKPVKEGAWEEYDHLDTLGGESLADQQARMVSFFEELKTKDFKEVIVCSHGDPLYTLFLHLKGQALPAHITDLSANPGFEYQDKATIRTVSITDDGKYGFQSIVQVDGVMG